MERRIIGGKPGASAPAVQRLTVDAESAGQRLDNFLIRQLKADGTKDMTLKYVNHPAVEVVPPAV